jgi:peptidoglycan/LPS O-acetylase OafA/YrhL
MTPRSQPLYLTPALTPATKGYVPSLDGLRAISILFVMVGHLVSEKIAPGGLGVEVFFVVSGFLIARLMLAEHKESGAVSLPKFYLRRFLRLYPVTLIYSLAVVAVFVLAGLSFYWGELWSVLGYYSNYYYRWFEHAHPGVHDLPFGIFWSLSVEEHFYLLFPPLFVLLKGKPDRLFWAMLAACVAGLCLRLGAGWADPQLVISRGLYYRTEFRLDAIAWGVLLAAACELDWGRRLIKALGHPGWFAAGLAAIAFTIVLRNPFFRETWRYSIQGAALFVLFAGVLFSARYRLLQQALNLAPALWIGRRSYSLYVWHLCTPDLSRWMLPHGSWALQTAVQFVLSFALAAGSYYGLEMPLARWRRRIGGAQTPAVSALESLEEPRRLGVGAVEDQPRAAPAGA